MFDNIFSHEILYNVDTWMPAVRMDSAAEKELFLYVYASQIHKCTSVLPAHVSNTHNINLPTLSTD